MAHITNGSVSYERRVKTGDFEHKHASVTVHYALEQGEDANEADKLIAIAGSLATGHVYQMLRAKPAIVQPSTASDTPAPVPVEHAPVVPAPVDVVDPVVAEPVVTNLRQAKRVAKAKAPVTNFVVEEFASGGDGGSLTIDHEPAPTPEPVVEDDFTAEAPAATDAEMGQALSRVNAKLKDAAKIRALIGEFVQSGQSYSLIPNVRRGEFMQKLEELA